MFFITGSTVLKGQAFLMGSKVVKRKPTLQALFSGTSLQTLPDLVTPLKGRSLSLYLRAAVHQRGQRPPKGLGTDKTVEAT